MNLKGAKKWFKKRERAKKLDINRSKLAFKEDFYMYFPNPSVDILKYQNKDGVIDIDQIPDEQLIEFTCRYLSAGEFSDLYNNDNAIDFREFVDVKKFHNLKGKDLDEAINKMNNKIINALIESQLKDKNPQELEAEVVFHSCLNPKFESVAQVRQILPMSILNQIADEALAFVDGQNLITLEDE